MKQFFIKCRRFNTQRKRLLEGSLRQVGLGITLTVILPFKASALKYCNRNVCDVIQFFRRNKDTNYVYFICFLFLTNACVTKKKKKNE